MREIPNRNQRGNVVVRKPKRHFSPNFKSWAVCSEIEEATRPPTQRSKRHHSPNFKRPAFPDLSAPSTRSLNFVEITRNFVKDF
ncbi:hypothetical protein ACFX11_025491 [Malus domestica]